MAAVQQIRESELIATKRMVVLREIEAINRACLGVANRLAQTDAALCAQVFRVTEKEVEALAVMSDQVLEAFAQAGICVLCLDRGGWVKEQGVGEASKLVKELQKLFSVTEAAVHRFASDVPDVCETAFRLTSREVREYAHMSGFEMRTLNVTCRLQITGLVALVDAANRERRMPQSMRRLHNIAIAARMAMVPITQGN